MATATLRPTLPHQRGFMQNGVKRGAPRAMEVPAVPQRPWVLLVHVPTTVVGARFDEPHGLYQGADDFMADMIKTALSDVIKLETAHCNVGALCALWHSFHFPHDSDLDHCPDGVTEPCELCKVVEAAKLRSEGTDVPSLYPKKVGSAMYTEPTENGVLRARMMKPLCLAADDVDEEASADTLWMTASERGSVAIFGACLAEDVRDAKPPIYSIDALVLCTRLLPLWLEKMDAEVDWVVRVSHPVTESDSKAHSVISFSALESRYRADKRARTGISSSTDSMDSIPPDVTLDAANSFSHAAPPTGPSSFRGALG